MSAHAVTAEPPLVGTVRDPSMGAPPTQIGPRRAGATAAATLAVAGVLCFVTFLAGGGLNLDPMTTLELTLTLAGGATVVGVLVLAPAGTRAYGAWPVVLLLAFTALTGLSVVWSVAPDASWQDTGRMLSYSGVFATTVALARFAPGGWRALLGGVVLAAVAVCAYALLTKVFPDRLDASDINARLQEPYGYWNAIGLTAAMGAVGCLWLGARRAGHALVSALSYPAMGLMLVTLMLAYSRGALAALVVGLVVWLSLVPLRLRGARVLIVGLIGAAPIVAWDFSNHALSNDKVALASRDVAGHQLGVLLGVMLVLLTLAGVAIGFFGDRRAPSATTRRGVGVMLVGLLVLALAAGAGGLAMSKRGLTGTISHDLSSLTDPNAPVPLNTPGRLTAIGSVRARYWKEALQIFEAHPALGSGAAGYETARLRYRTEPLDVKQAHGYVVQTLADLGIAGLILTLALLAAWMGAAGRCTHPFNRRWGLRRSPWSISWTRAPEVYTPERIGLLTMLSIVVVFGVHSFADWTWYVPGDACVALLCAGWLAGRGPLPRGEGNLTRPAGAPAAGPVSARTSQGWHPPSARQLGPMRVGLAIATVVVALIASWTEWQPQRSVDASEHAVALLGHNPVAALAAAQAGVSRDPLSALALFRLSAVQQDMGQQALARATLQKAVRLQPSNPETWLTLGEYDMTHNPAAAVEELRAAVYLNPASIPTQNTYVQALRAAPQATAQKRLRRPLTSKARRANGVPPAPRASTSSKPKSSSRRVRARRV